MTYLKSKKFNLSQIVDILIVLGFALFFIKIIADKKVLEYVHPRIVPYIKFAALYLFIIIPFMLRDLRKKRTIKPDILQYIILVLTLVLAFTIPPITLSASNAGNKTSFNVGTNKDSNQIAANNESNTAADTNDNSSTAEDAQDPDVLYINDDNYSKTINDIYGSLDNYVGKKVEMLGFVYKSDKMKKNEFVIGRYLMTCCSADLGLIGLYCDYDQTDKLNKDEWFTIKGVIEKGTYDKQTIPKIKIVEIKSIPIPENEYVYP